MSNTELGFVKTSVTSVTSVMKKNLYGITNFEL